MTSNTVATAPEAAPPAALPTLRIAVAQERGVADHELKFRVLNSVLEVIGAAAEATGVTRSRYVRDALCAAASREASAFIQARRALHIRCRADDVVLFERAAARAEATGTQWAVDELFRAACELGILNNPVE